MTFGRSTKRRPHNQEYVDSRHVADVLIKTIKDTQWVDREGWMDLGGVREGHNYDQNTLCKLLKVPLKKIKAKGL